MQIKKNGRGESYSDNADYLDDANVTRGVPAFEAPEPITRQRREPEQEQAPVESPVAAAPRQIESVIDAHSTFDGRYEAGQDLRVLGTMSGELVCRGLLTIEQGAAAKARIQARDAMVHGQVEGDIVCSGRLLLSATAVVNGTIKAGSLVVEEGASIAGTVQTASAATAPAPAAVPTPIAQAEKPEAAAPAAESADASRSTRWNRATRDVPNFAIVSSDERASTTLDRN